MTSDPFEQLRLPEDPAAPDPRFVARLRNRVVAALADAGLATVDLPSRTAPATDADEPPSVTAPDTTPTITPYLCVAPAAAAIDWYVAVLGAVEQVRYTGDDGRIGHAELTIGPARFMLSDEYPEVGGGVVSPATLGGTSMSMHVVVGDVDAVYARVRADGRARVGRPPHDEPYGARAFDMVDPFGHRWMIQAPTGTPSHAEIEAQMDGYTITGDDPAAST